MDDKRAETLDALQVFIQTQKALLARTHSDIERLQKLKRHVLEDPSSFLDNLSQELDASSFRLSDQVDCQLALPTNLHWSVFEARDPAALHALTLTSRQAYLRRNDIPTTQRSELSDLQKLVKRARCTIIDPVLSSIGYISEPEVGESDAELDPEERRREQEREKIRELKKRKIQASGLKLPSSIRARGPSGVFIRHDVEDESMDVDISLGDQAGDGSGGDPSLLSTPMLVDTPASSSTPFVSPPPPSPARVRKPTVKAKAKAKAKLAKDPDASQLPRKKAEKAADADDDSDAETAPRKPARASSSKPKPETYKQAWSVEEQNLLEQLLEQIPDGEKFRWQKISRAMDGKRTPRQVASRVQKYFEKLKRFGIGVDGAGAS